MIRCIDWAGHRVIRWTWISWLAILPLTRTTVSDEPLFHAAALEQVQPTSEIFNSILLGSLPVEAPLGSGTIQLIADSAT
ncbi:MAG: hypothetical protein ACYC6N_29905, partial [Pirellulaceae bacterium]